MPLRSRGQVVGVMAYLTRSPRFYTEAETATIHTIADILGTGLENARLHTELARSEQKYRTLFDSIDEGFCIIEMLFDADGRPADYRFLEANAAFERQTGLHEAEGKLMRELAPDHEAHWFETYGRIALTGEPARFVNQAKALRRWYDVYAFRFGDPESRRVAILFNDITERRRAEAERERLLRLIQESEAQYHSLFESIDESFVLVRLLRDESGEPRDFLFLEVNPVWERLFRPRDEAVGKPMSEVMPELLGYWRQVATTVLEEGGTVREERYSPLSETWGAFHAYSPGEDLFAVLWKDITERKRAEEALRESEQKFSVMFDKAPVAATLSRLPEGVLLDVNEAFVRAFGYTREEAIGKTTLELGIAPDTEGRARIIPELQARGFVRDQELTLHTKTGEERAFSVSVDMVEIGGQKYVLSMTHDITEQKAAEAERERLLAELNATIESIADGVVVYTPDGGLAYMNVGAERILGYTLEARGHSVEDQAWLMGVETAEGEPIPGEDTPTARALRGESVHNVVMAIFAPTRRGSGFRPVPPPSALRQARCWGRWPPLPI